ncbi:MAG TPA: carboxylating nicotinate-nucleotide diphosphorylase [Bryobacteraceae bacterium]|nr:carboxylating nicotinate-nucleotide diphosphorylase [Bryobacteraceae bacterium]
MFDTSHPEVERAIRAALEEDIGAGDVTTRSCIPESTQASGRFLAREPMVLAGIELLPLLYEMRGGVDQLDIHRASGDWLSPGDRVATVSGKAWTLLECERTALNFVQRLSGVATLARQYADAVKHTRCRILDTRKTTPGLRRLEKMAVAAGGAVNHRIGLFDAILIKNNHIAAAGGVRAALERSRAASLPIEIEVRTRAELDEALACGAKHLLLDNLTPAEAAVWIRYIDGRASVELSGGITLETVSAYAESGADYISCGAITHSARAMNLNFRLELHVL